MVNISILWYHLEVNFLCIWILDLKNSSCITDHRSIQMDINIYVEENGQPVLALSKIELASKSGLMYDILRSRADCDCKEPVSVIVTSYDERTVTAALSRFVHFKKKGYSIIPGKSSVV